jgi:hypothetical protein
VSYKRIVVNRTAAILVAVVILGLGIIGTGLSTLYEQNEWLILGQVATIKVSYGFPVSWYGYSFREGGATPIYPPPRAYWFSLGSFLLDAAFWFAISFFVSIASVKPVKILLRKIGSKVVVTYFLASLSFLAVGLGLSLITQTFKEFLTAPALEIIPYGPFHPYSDLGLRLFAFGIFLVAASFYQTLVRERKISQKHPPTIS